MDFSRFQMGIASDVLVSKWGGRKVSTTPSFSDLQANDEVLVAIYKGTAHICASFHIHQSTDREPSYVPEELIILSKAKALEVYKQCMDDPHSEYIKFLEDSLNFPDVICFVITNSPNGWSWTTVSKDIYDKTKEDKACIDRANGNLVSLSISNMSDAKFAYLFGAMQPFLGYYEESACDWLPA